MPKLNMQELWEPLEELIRRAGAAIMEVYEDGNFETELKDDRFPLTKADKASHELLTRELAKLTPHVRIMSEEAEEGVNEDIANDEIYWCIDPLDGTNEFVHRRDQFVVNIGLINQDGPIAGMVYAPAFDDLFWGEKSVGAWRNKSSEGAEEIRVNQNTQARNAVGSLSHLDDKTKAFMDELGDVEIRQYGSALKLTAVASGEVDIYPRFAPTMEWDTAAPHAIVLAAGGEVLGLDGQELKYRKSELRNPGFICYNGKVKLPEFKVQ